MIRTERNAEAIAYTELSSKTTKQLYEGAISASNHDNETLFTMTMQSYITRLGMLISNCLINQKIESSSQKIYLNSLNYICINVLHNNELLQHFYKTGLNIEGNKGKHSLDDIRINISSYLGYYNEMINQIISETGIKEFSCCHITPRYPNYKARRNIPTVSGRESGFSSNVVGGVSIKPILANYYGSTPCIRFSCSDAYTYRKVKVQIRDPITNSVLYGGSFTLERSHQKESFNLDRIEHRRNLVATVRVYMVSKKRKSLSFGTSRITYDESLLGEETIRLNPGMASQSHHIRYSY